MESGTPAARALWRSYREELRGERTIRSVRLGAFLVGTINTAFILLDRWIFGDVFELFLATRLALNAILATILVWTARTHPSASQFVGVLATGLMLLVVIYGTGAGESDYYAGLMLLFIGMPVVTVLSTREAAWLVGLLFGTFVCSPLVVGQPQDSTRYFLHSAFLLCGGLTGVASSGMLDRVRYRDFLRRRELESARDHLRALDKQKSRFTANVHHELRTPLTLMLAPLDTLLGGDLGPVAEEQRRYLSTMRENGLRLLKLINQLLDLARIEGDQHKLERRRLDPGDLVARIVDSARPLAERKGVTLEATGLADLPVIRVDVDAFEKVLVNLLGNALKFTDRGGSITVSARATGEELRLEVADTGIGIPADELGRVFDRFAQVDGSATRRHEGTGIGLALVKELIELHDGRVEAASEGEGRGSRFSVVLPVRTSPDDDEAEEVVRDEQGRGLAAEDAFAAVGAELAADVDAQLESDDAYRVVELRRSVERAEASERGVDQAESGLVDGPEILVVEDNADMRRLLAFILGREFRVRLAENGRRGLEAVRERKPDLVLSDVMMPEMSGLELCAELKGDEATRSVPVVLVTSKAEREMKIEGLERGADDYVTKPFHPRELLARVRNLVRLHWLQGELEDQNAALARALEELKSAEVQLVHSERLAAVGELAAGVAHEVNNPVNFALNAVRTLRRSVGDLRAVAEKVADLQLGDVAKLEAQLGEVRQLQADLGFEELSSTLDELVTIVAEGLERTSKLVGDLRDFASPGRSQQGSVDVRRGIESTVQLLRRTAADAGAEIRVEMPPSLPLIEGDPGAFNQLILNLLKNAVEAFDRPGGTVRIQAEVEEGPTLVVRFQDDGPGVDPELEDRLFEPFFTTKEAGRGTGLGLSISRRIAQEHGGDLELDSRSGQGAIFVLRLPCGAGAGDTGEMNAT